LIENHRPVTFVEQEFSKQPGFTRVEKYDELTVTGICPRCGALTSMTFTKGTPQGSKGLFRRTSAPPDSTKFAVVYCQCGHVHAHRPADSPESGCGAYWPVDLT
jgi:hypothetical protein